MGVSGPLGVLRDDSLRVDLHYAEARSYIYIYIEKVRVHDSFVVVNKHLIMYTHPSLTMGSFKGSSNEMRRNPGESSEGDKGCQKGAKRASKEHKKGTKRVPTSAQISQRHSKRTPLRKSISFHAKRGAFRYPCLV